MPLTDEQIKKRKKIVRLYSNGMTVKMVADAVSETKGFVMRVLNDM